MANKVLERLLEGNERFTKGLRSIDSMISVSKMHDLAVNGQRPSAVILTCSDSRAPAEIIFDLGVGELFVVRVAGNVVAPSLIASMEFAVSNFGSSVLMVLGHTQCGAVQAALNFDTALTDSPVSISKNLLDLVGRIRPSVEKAKVSHSTDILLDSIKNNIKASIESIKSESSIIKKLVDDKKLLLVGAILDIQTGRVSVFEEL